MPPIRVGVPGVGVVEFPEGTSQEEIQAAISTKKAPFGITPLQQAQGLLRAEGLESGPEAGIRAGIKRAALPIAATAAAGAAGPALGLGVAGTAALEGLAGLGAFGANVGLGIEEFSPGQAVLSGAAPPISRAVGGVVGLLKKRIPGTAVALQEEAASGLRALAGRYRPIKIADQLFDELAQTNPSLRIPTSSLRSTSKKLLMEEQAAAGASKSLVSKEVQSLADDLSKLKDLSPNQMRVVLKRLGQKTGSVRGLISTEEREAAKAAYKALQEDVESAIKAGGDAGEAALILKMARDSIRRERAVAELGDVIETGIFKREGDLLESVKPKKILEAFQKNRIMRESFSKEEQKQIVDAVSAYRGLPGLPPAAGPFAGAGRPLTAGAGAAAAARMIGAEEGTATTIGLTFAAAPWLIARASTTEPGRALMRRLMISKGFLDHRGLAILGAYIRAQSGETRGAFEVQPE